MTSCVRRSMRRSASGSSATDPPSAEPVDGERELVDAPAQLLEDCSDFVLMAVIAVQQQETPPPRPRGPSPQGSLGARPLLHPLDAPGGYLRRQLLLLLPPPTPQ